MNKQAILTLINSGLYQDNLIKLSKLCKDNLRKHPTLFYVLIKIFESLEAEYNEQAVPSERYEHIESIKESLIETINNPTLDNLDKLIISFDT